MQYPRQRTICKAVNLSGKGLHTGEDSSVSLHPAEPGAGIVFVAGGVEIRALASNVCDTRRGTSLGCCGVQIHTVEHLLSALAGVQIDNARIEITGSEVPVMDGSALPFVELIDRAGIECQDACAQTDELHGPVWALDGDKCLVAAPSDAYTLSVLISFNHKLIGEQAASFRIDPETYRNEIAPARTFCTSDEIEYILSQGLGKGGTEENVVVAYDDHYSVPLRFNDEPVRHKLLDLIGDLSLIGGRFSANVMGLRPSHTLNIDLARRIRKIGAQ